jgi:hypothetical protein
MARRTVRVAEIVRLFGYAAGDLPSERLLARLAMPVSDNAILRQLKRRVRERTHRTIAGTNAAAPTSRSPRKVTKTETG